MWIPLKGAQALIKKLGGGKEGFQKALKQKPELFQDTGPRKTTALDPKTGKPKSGQKASKAAPKAKSLSGHPLSSTGNRSGRSAWDKLPQRVKDKLLKEKGKGMSKGQLEKYREMYRNRN